MVYIFIIVISFLLTWRVRAYAIRKSIIDIPNDRSSHTIPTPRETVWQSLFPGLQD